MGTLGSGVAILRTIVALHQRKMLIHFDEPVPNRDFILVLESMPKLRGDLQDRERVAVLKNDDLFLAVLPLMQNLILRTQQSGKEFLVVQIFRNITEPHTWSTRFQRLHDPTRLTLDDVAVDIQLLH